MNENGNVRIVFTQAGVLISAKLQKRFEDGLTNFI